MFNDLPDQLKKRVREYLAADDFRTAKEIYDDWQAQQLQEWPQTSLT